MKLRKKKALKLGNASNPRWLRLDDDELARVEAAARAFGMSTAAWMREAVLAYLRQYEASQK